MPKTTKPATTIEAPAMTRGQKAAATRKSRQARDAIALLAEQTATKAAEAAVTLPTKAQLDAEEAACRAEEAANLAAEAEALALEAAAPKEGYNGPMLALRAASKAGKYVKQANGQPACGDEVATILGVLTPEMVVRACIAALALPGNPYLHLNVGQQSMNLRNKLRGAIKRGEFGMGVLREAAEDEQDRVAAQLKAAAAAITKTE